MSIKQFNQFLVEKIIEWFEKHIKTGYRYSFYSDDNDYIKELLRQLYCEEVNYILYRETQLPYIEINNIKLIFLNDVEKELNQNFISTIRDAVSKPEKEFINSALFILHRSRLDTLINSTYNLTDIDNSPLNIFYLKDMLIPLCNGNIVFETLLNYCAFYKSCGCSSWFARAKIVIIIINRSVKATKKIIISDNIYQNCEIWYKNRHKRLLDVKK